MRRDASLRSVLEPASIVVVGASQDRGKLGRKLLDNLDRHFSGEVHAVNPTATAEDTRIHWHRDIADLPAGIDLAVVSVSPERIWPALDALAGANVGAVALLADRLASRDGSGGADADLRRFVDETGIRVLGPNSSGVRDLSRGLIATFAGDTFEIGPAGGIDLISQSGGMLAYLGGTLLRTRNSGLRFMIDVGNEVDICAADCLAYLTDRGADRVGLVLEGCPDWVPLHRALIAAADRGTRVVALQIGHSARGRQIAASHTGALVGSHDAFRVALERFGVTVVEDETEFVDALALPRLAGTNRVVLASFSGGTNALTSDLLTARGFAVPPLAELVDGDQMTLLRNTLKGAVVDHPIDLGPWAMRDPQQITTSVLACVAASPVAAVVVVTSHVSAMPDVGPALVQELYQLAGKLTCPLLVIGSVPDEARRSAPGNVMFLAEPARAVRSLAFAATATHAPAREDAAPAAVVGQTALSWRQAADALAGAGVVTAPTVEARTAAEAVAAANRLGYPVVLKVDSPRLFHRSRAGCVRLNVADEDAAATAFAALINRAAELHLPDAVCLVQSQLDITAELFVGIDLAEPFGPVVALAAGGVDVERGRSRTLLPVPPDRTRLVDALRRIVAAEGLDDSAATTVADTVERICALARQRHEEFASIELNPLCVTTEFSGGIAIDALMVTRSRPEGASHR